MLTKREKCDNINELSQDNGITHQTEECKVKINFRKKDKKI